MLLPSCWWEGTAASWTQLHPRPLPSAVLQSSTPRGLERRRCPSKTCSVCLWMIAVSILLLSRSYHLDSYQIHAGSTGSIRCGWCFCSTSFIQARDDRTLIVGRYRPSPRTQTFPSCVRRGAIRPLSRPWFCKPSVPDGPANRNGTLAIAQTQPLQLAFGWFTNTRRGVLGVHL